MSSCTVALLGQPNSGKSTLFNALTGSKQHVGNWPGKTVERKFGEFSYGKTQYTVVDLPGAYSLSANSDEEIVTRDYIAGGYADVVCVMADASQLERSLFMLADYVGIRVPAFLMLNMMDVATSQGKQIDAIALEDKLGIPVLPFAAVDRKEYAPLMDVLAREGKKKWLLKERRLNELYRTEFQGVFDQILAFLPAKGIETYSPEWLAVKLLEEDEVAFGMVEGVLENEKMQELRVVLSSVENGTLRTGNCKFQWIEEVLKGCVIGESEEIHLSKFDQLAISPIFGKILAVAIILLGLVLSIICAAPLMIVGNLIPSLADALSDALLSIGVADLLVSLLCQGILTAVSFAVMMTGFVFGTSLVFGFMEEVGYMARISFVFDHLMKRLGLQGKAIMPFLVSFGCNIGGGTGTRVLDSWGQRMTAIALSWVVPCSSTWAVVGLVSSLFFGVNAVWVVLSMFFVALLHMVLTAKLFGKRLLSGGEHGGLIMELPPYHKPRWGSLLRYVWSRMGDVLARALKIIVLVSVIFWALSYSGDGNIEHSIIYSIGTFIEPVTMFFGLRWQLFMAWLSSGMGKEACLGVLASLFQSSGGFWSAIEFQKSATVDSAAIGSSMLQAVSKPEALAFLYAFFFNMPCLMALSSAAHETHSLKWTVRIALYYMGVSLILAMIVYHIGLVLF